MEPKVYKIINDYRKLVFFIAWLPDLRVGECYYLTLFARKKYHPSAHNDKCQCKRATATSKGRLLHKIEQLEIAIGQYVNKHDEPLHNDSLAVYVSVNPRSLFTAQKRLIKKLADTITGNEINRNPTTLAMSAIQQAKSRTVYVDFDFDGVEYMHHVWWDNIINRDAYSVLKTRGGFHLLVSPKDVHDEFKKTWHRNLSTLPHCDVKGDNLIPVAGCCQGGFTPTLIC